MFMAQLGLHIHSMWGAVLLVVMAWNSEQQLNTTGAALFFCNGLQQALAGSKAFECEKDCVALSHCCSARSVNDVAERLAKSTSQHMSSGVQIRQPKRNPVGAARDTSAGH